MSALTNSLKQRLRDGDEPLYGLWLTLAGAAAEALAHAGYRMIALSADVSWLLRATRQALQEVRS